MARSILLLLALLATSVYGQKVQSTPIPPNITMQPTDLMALNRYSGLIIVPLPTQGFAVELSAADSSTTSLSIPCTAVAIPQNVKYLWYKWNQQATGSGITKWQLLTSGSKYMWSTQINGDQSNAGMLKIAPYDKVTDAGLYICTASIDFGTAVSKVLNLTTAYVPNEGAQGIMLKKACSVGDYVRLDGVSVITMPQLVPSWARTPYVAVPTGSSLEIPPDRTVMDEQGSLHITYIDNTLLQVQTSSGLTDFKYFHYKFATLRNMIIDVAPYQIAMTGTSPLTASCKWKYSTPLLNLVHGQSSRIACVYAGSPLIKIGYSKLGANNQYQALTSSVNSGGDAATAVTLTGVYGNTYMIGAAQTTDAGTYMCQASCPGGIVCEGTVYPIVVVVDLEPTFVLQPPSVVYAVNGESLTLEWRVKGRPKPTFDLGQNGVPSVSDPRISVYEPPAIIDPSDNYTIYIRTMKLANAIKGTDSRSVQMYATNPYYIAVSSVSIAVLWPITFPPETKMAPQLALKPGAVASFTCLAKGDDALPLTISWMRVSTSAITYPLYASPDNTQFEIIYNEVNSPADYALISSTLRVHTSKGVDLDASRGQYACNVTNGVTSNLQSARLSFEGDDPVTASFEMWMLGPILGGVAAILLVVGIIIVVRRNRGEKYEVEDEEIKKGYDPKKEAHDQRELREYQRDREKDAEPLRQSHVDAEIEREDEA